MVEEVVQGVLWTASAKRTYNNIINYLLKEWSDKEVAKFVNRTSEMIFLL